MAPQSFCVRELLLAKDGNFNLVDWLRGVVMIYLVLFGTGNIIFGHLDAGFIMIPAGGAFGGLVYCDLNKRDRETIGEQQADKIMNIRERTISRLQGCRF